MPFQKIHNFEENYFAWQEKKCPLSYLSAAEWVAVVSHTEVRDEVDIE
jgi:hypothetical protein